MTVIVQSIVFGLLGLWIGISSVYLPTKGHRI